MKPDPIAETRIQALNSGVANAKGRYVLYWMQQSQRVACNHALEYAVQAANRRQQPLLVLFALTPDYPEANLRHFTFMAEGLAEIRQRLAQRNIPMQIRIGSPAVVALQSARQASVLICDRGYLRHQRQWRQHAASQAHCLVIQVESDAIVPLEVVSQKAEYAARTIRPKIQRRLSEYLTPLRLIKLKQSDMALAQPFDLNDLLSQLAINRRVPPVTSFLKGGYKAAHRRFQTFIVQKLSNYPELRNQPQIDGSSMMSPYLHFGQIAALELALMVQQADAPPEAKQALLEELIVRRELAINHVFFNPTYDQYEGLPAWTRRTLAEHISDSRKPCYALKQLEAADTHDPYWNAAMNEMKYTGYMHNYMRMYWGKKILQWGDTPHNAFQTALALNNKYFLDGRDPNSYAGVEWIFGLHDRPWKERPIFGKVRYMARSGLERKCDINGYVQKVQNRIDEMRSHNATR